MVDQKIVRLNNNVIPRGLVKLERLFDANNVRIKIRKQTQEEDVEYYNIGAKQQPKVIKMAKGNPNTINKGM